MFIKQILQNIYSLPGSMLIQMYYPPLQKRLSGDEQSHKQQKYQLFSWLDLSVFLSIPTLLQKIKNIDGQ